MDTWGARQERRGDLVKKATRETVDLVYAKPVCLNTGLQGSPKNSRTLILPEQPEAKNQKYSRGPNTPKTAGGQLPKKQPGGNFFSYSRGPMQKTNFMSILENWRPAAPKPPAKPGGCAPRTLCNTGGLRPPDPLQYWGAAPPRPPAILGGCAARTPCNTEGIFWLKMIWQRPKKGCNREYARAGPRQTGARYLKKHDLPFLFVLPCGRPRS